MFKIVMCAGTVRQDAFKGLTYKNALELCEGYGWEISPDGDGGFVWDLEIVEE